MNICQSEKLFYIQKITAVYNHLRTSEKKVADWVLKNGAQLITMSLAALGIAAGTSEPSVVRFVRACGYNSFNEFKLSVAQDLGKMEGLQSSPLMETEIREDEPIENLPQKVVLSTKRALDELERFLDPEQIKKAVKAIIKAKRIDIYGVGNSSIVAEDLSHKLMRLGFQSRSFSDPHVQIMSACSLKKGDVAIGISHSGKTRDIIDSVTVAKDNGATVMSITNYLADELLQLSDICLMSGAAESAYYSETMISRIAQLSIVDILYTALFLNDYDLHTESIKKMHQATGNKQI